MIGRKALMLLIVSASCLLSSCVTGQLICIAKNNVKCPGFELTEYVDNQALNIYPDNLADSFRQNPLDGLFKLGLFGLLGLPDLIIGSVGLPITTTYAYLIESDILPISDTEMVQTLALPGTLSTVSRNNRRIQITSMNAKRLSKTFYNRLESFSGDGHLLNEKMSNFTLSLALLQFEDSNNIKREYYLIRRKPSLTWFVFYEVPRSNDQRLLKPRQVRLEPNKLIGEFCIDVCDVAEFAEFDQIEFDFSRL